MNKPKIDGIYTHYKKPDRQYRVIGIALHTETEEEMVVYEPLYENPSVQLFVRPLKMFVDDVEIEDKKVPRFQLQSK